MGGAPSPAAPRTARAPEAAPRGRRGQPLGAGGGMRGRHTGLPWPPRGEATPLGEPARASAASAPELDEPWPWAPRAGSSRPQSARWMWWRAACWSPRVTAWSCASCSPRRGARTQPPGRSPGRRCTSCSAAVRRGAVWHGPGVMRCMLRSPGSCLGTREPWPRLVPRHGCSTGGGVCVVGDAPLAPQPPPVTMRTNPGTPPAQPFTMGPC